MTAKQSTSKAILPNKALAKPLAVVGIGASAGGLEAITAFLSAVPNNSGLAFVVVQHLNPNHKGALPELLQRVTPLAVSQVEDGMTLEPNRVYVIPPNRDLSLQNNTFLLLEPAVAHGLHLPIDTFFRALADDQHNRSVGVILSGMGSDGTLGLSAIKEQAGVAFVQEPATAQFDSMPRSAIDAGLADVVAPAEALPQQIIDYLTYMSTSTAAQQTELSENDRRGIAKVTTLLNVHTGHDFSLYKKNTLHRRIERRMGLHKLPKIVDYVRFLQQNPQEIKLLFNELLIGVTRFFRDPGVWEQLKSEIIPALLEQYPRGAVLRAWIPACSTGEEAYSVAITFRETLDALSLDAHYSLQIFATDLDPDAIDRARTGIYPASIATDVSEQRLRRYFVIEEDSFKVSKGIREMVIFAPQNLIMDPPFTKLDLITCRNLLIYFEADLQKKVLQLFHYSLNPNGILLLGTSETVGAATTVYDELSTNNRIYQRKSSYSDPSLVDFPARFAHSDVNPRGSSGTPPASSTSVNLQSLTDQLLVQQFSPAAVLTTQQGDIVYISGKTGKYLEPAAGKANLNVFAMAREGLSSSLNATFSRAVRQQTTGVIESQKVGTNGGSQQVRVTVQPLTEPPALDSMVLITFTDLPTLSADKLSGASLSGTQGDTEQANLALELELELEQAQEELKITREEMQISQEELKSTNEELQSTNEELQSTNEELTTSKEEMQSMNEELQTVNQELQVKLDELTLASDDMKNLLNSTSIATLFLDQDLNVRRFTNQTKELFKLIPADAGRPITDLASDLDYGDLEQDANNVLDTLIFKERQVQSHDGHWYRMRIMPYRTQNNRIDGVVITFVDISSVKALELSQIEAIEVLQHEIIDQAQELGLAKELELKLRQVQTKLEKRLQQR
ncbi:MAG: chemotaxis protein CheB [Halopseudomonas sp.]